MIRIALASASLAVLAACASTPVDEPVAPAAPTSETPAPSIEAADTSPIALAFSTVDALLEQGNEQAAIDRLTQLLGSPDLSDADTANILFRRGQIRGGEGNDVWGAIEDVNAALDLGTFTDASTIAATELRDTLNGEATSINFLLETGDLSRTERFEMLFRLGQHQDAIDMMLQSGLVPENEYLIDLMQMGYLCEGSEYAGPVYGATEPDGTARSLQYCDFGK